MHKAPGKKIKDICLQLGEPYTIKVIDRENSIYRDLGNGFDIEVSGLDNQKKSINASIYVWQTKNFIHTVETIHDINSIIELKDTLGYLAIKYLNISIANPDRIQN